MSPVCAFVVARSEEDAAGGLSDYGNSLALADAGIALHLDSCGDPHSMATLGTMAARWAYHPDFDLNWPSFDHADYQHSPMTFDDREGSLT